MGAFLLDFILTYGISFDRKGRRPIVAKGKYHKWLEPENLLLLEAWARNGLTDEQIAENMGIRGSTFYDWKNKYSEISEALKKGKEVIDILVENALLKRALGYEYKEITKEGGVQTKEVTKQVPPDTTALIFWLKNRRPDLWRDRKDVDVSSTGGFALVVNDNI